MTSEAPQDPSDRLIDQLASHLEPVRPIAGIPRMLAALASVIAVVAVAAFAGYGLRQDCLLYTSPSPRDRTRSRMPSSA